ncbi:hypothetical protein DFH27DRAFT_560422 [Peziza echinospora]|nr:hypothetical protein DFH27DRAFT_560422 [Peziza echinospora]
MAMMNRGNLSSENNVSNSRVINRVDNVVSNSIHTSLDIHTFTTHNYHQSKNVSTICNISEQSTYENLFNGFDGLQHYRERHIFNLSYRWKDTGTWFLYDQRYLRWRDDPPAGKESRTLCCYAVAGTGKSILTSVIVENLLHIAQQETNVGVGCIYCTAVEKQTYTVSNILLSLLQQFCGALSHGTKELESILVDLRWQNSLISMEEISELLAMVLKRLQGAYVCIDGLDELKPQTRRNILMCLAAQDLGNVKVFLTGRSEIQGEVRRIFGSFGPEGGQETVVNFLSDTNDIRQYLKDKIAGDPHWNAELDKGFKEKIVNAIANRAGGVFLVALLHINEILMSTTLNEMKRSLEDPKYPAEFASIINAKSGGNELEQALRNHLPQGNLDSAGGCQQIAISQTETKTRIETNSGTIDAHENMNSHNIQDSNNLHDSRVNNSVKSVTNTTHASFSNCVFVDSLTLQPGQKLDFGPGTTVKIANVHHMEQPSRPPPPLPRWLRGTRK